MTSDARSPRREAHEPPRARPRGARAPRAALALVRSTATRCCAGALEVDRFDDALRDEVARMGQLMHDALGIGLAATQVGVMHRLLVYRVEPDAPSSRSSTR